MIRFTRLSSLCLFLCVSVSLWCNFSSAATHVQFDPNGNFLLNDKPFFPIGIWVYDLGSSVVKDIKAKGFNTVVGNGFHPDELDKIHAAGMYALPFATPEFLQASIPHPALLAWYVTDEPEGHGSSPEEVKKQHEELKAKDPNHPGGLCHFLFDAFVKYKDCSDFTMSDVYPVTANRDVPLHNVGIHMDQARKAQGNPHWPVIPFIQVFGGPDTDGGKWAQPTGEEVRAMTFIGLVHRANGIFVFSYWAKYPKTWNSLAHLNSDITRLVPWLVGDGTEIKATSDKPAVEIRAKKLGDSWLVIAVNSERTPCDAVLNVDQLADTALNGFFDKKSVTAVGGKIAAHFAPLEVKVFVAGAAPH